MQIKIYEKNPSGSNSIKAACAYITNTKTRADDISPVWPELKSFIQNSVNYEFSEANPNQWQPDSPAWQQEKMAQGKPVTTGIYTGALKKAASSQANVTETKNSLYWVVNESVTNSFGATVGSYASSFAEDRPIFRYTISRVRGIVSRAIAKWVRGK